MQVLRVKVGSLFSGIGGLELGFERAGMEVAFQAEYDKQARRVLERHWPDVHRYEDVHDVRDAANIDVLCGGYPCQDYSVAGKRSGLAGDRGALWWEMHRIVAECRPTWVVGENVPGLLSSNGGRDFRTIVNSLVQIGYGVCWTVLDSQYFGVAQRRRRLFIVGHSGGVPRPEILAISEGLFGHPAPSREAGKETSGYTPNQFGGYREGVGTLRAPAARGYKNPPVAFDTTQITSVDNRSNPQPGDPCHPIAAGAHAPAIAFHTTQDPISGHIAPAMGVTSGPMGVAIAFHYTSLHYMGASQPEVGPTLKVGSGIGMTGTAAVVAFNGDQSEKARSMGEAVEQAPSLRTTASHVSVPTPRRLTPLECERLQGFPDEWTRYYADGTEVADGPRYRMLGNAVTVNVAEWIGRRIMEAG